MLGMVFTPPSAGALHALLNDVAVGAFDFSRTDGQAPLDRVLVIELIRAIAEIAVALPDRGLAILYRRRFKMRLQFLQYGVGLIRFESAFLLVHPRFLRLLIAINGLSGGAEIVARMKEIDQVAALRAKFLLDLIRDPGGAIADAMNGGVRAKSRLDRAVKKALPGHVDIAL